MICVDCRGQRHTGCRGGSWCDCQHVGYEVERAAAEFEDAMMRTHVEFVRAGYVIPCADPLCGCQRFSAAAAGAVVMPVVA